jgi:hypothetical protein
MMSGRLNSREMADAKPFGSALYQSLTSENTEDYEYRTSSIYEISMRCIRLRIGRKRLKLCYLVARDGVEPPTPAFSGLDPVKI